MPAFHSTFRLLSVATLTLTAIAACSAASPGRLRTDDDGGTPEEGQPGSPGSTQPANTKPEDGPKAATPSVTGIAPSSATVGGATPTLIVTGSGFVPRSFIEVEFVPLPTTFVSEKELRATVPDDVLKATGARRITVSTAAPGGGTSGPVTFEIQNPVPAVTALSPTNALLNATATTVTVTGSGFAAGSKLTFGGTELEAAVSGPTTLTVTLPTERLNVSGTFPITIVNAAPGGGTSSPLAFTVANTNISISTLAPVSAEIGAANAALSLTGNGFVSGSTVSFNGTALTTTFASATRLTASVPSTLLVTPGNFPVVVTNPNGGGVSVPANFQVANPAPAVASISPARAAVGAGATTLTVTGSRFVRGSEIRIDGVPQTTTYTSASELTTTLPATLLAAAKTLSVSVFTRAPGGGASSAIALVVDNPGPAVTGTSPSSLLTGTTDVPMQVLGANFVAGSVVTIAGADAATTFESTTTLRVVVPAARLTAPGTLAFAVRNPSPGGGVSPVRSVTVSAASRGSCESSGVDVVLTELNGVKVKLLDYKYGPAPRFIYSSTDASYSTCPVAELSTSTQNYAAVVVQNATDTTRTLSSWTPCATDRDDAFMAVYELQSSSIPTTDLARKSCSKRVSNGSGAAGGFASPESAGSIGCPGLTKNNKGAIMLLPCERAIVLVQPYMYPTYNRPGKIALKLEE